MNDALSTVIEKALPERLETLQRVSGLPVVFGGGTQATPKGQVLEISRLAGTLGTSLRGLRVSPGRGMGGAVLRDGVTCRVNDYASADKITHHYDSIVVSDEHITSVLAVPVVVRGTVRGVLYGAARGREPVGDRSVRAAEVVARQLQRDVEQALTDNADSRRPAPPTALDELAAIIGETLDDALKGRLSRIYEQLTGRDPEKHASQPAATTRLSPREVEALRLVATGACNVEIAAELRLSPETVKAYLRTAMQKLGAPNRTGAVHAARLAGIL